MIQDINEISDGKIYGVNDMVRAESSSCEGCHACCEKMGDSILVDPYDCYRLTTGLGKSFEELLAESVELHVEEGMIVPNLKMTAENEQCFYLNEEGRCSIHDLRPGLCRVFPLGRLYEENGVSYFLQKDACKKEGRTKVKVAKWLDTPELKKYQQYLLYYHNFKKKMQEYLTADCGENEAKTVNMLLLNQLYLKPYEAEMDFYTQFLQRIEEIEKM